MTTPDSVNAVDSSALSFLDERSSQTSYKTPLHEVLHRVLLFSTALVKSDSCFIYLREGEELVLRASKNPHPEIIDRLKLKVGEGITGWVAEHRKAVAVPVNAWKDPRFKLFSDVPEDRFESFLSVPIMTRGRAVGVINLQNREAYDYKEMEIAMISAIGALVGAEVEMARLETESAQDQGERKKAEARFYKAFNANPEPMALATLSEGLYLDVNESFLRATGFDRAEVVGHTSEEVKIWSREEDRRKLVQALENHGRVRDVEIAFRTKSGEERTGLASVEIIEAGGQVCTLSIIRDITDRKQLELQLRQAQKMEAIGRLTGGIAHDFNNLLGVIIGYSELLLDELAGGASQRHAEQIQKAAERAAGLIRQLLAFSRQQVVEKKAIQLNAVLADMIKMLPKLIGEHIELRTKLDPATIQILADQGQIEQVILNLVVNARDAMPQGGKLLIETGKVQLDQEFCNRHAPMTPGSYATLVVSDTGTGMDARTQAHIFEPFFTTKEQGKGTGLGLGLGLGLATVYGAVRQTGGYIWVYSELGIGTTFRIYLPLLGADVAASRAVDAGPPTSVRGTETVLIVEDEEALRDLIASLLEDAGYSVLEASDGRKALAVALNHPGPIELLLTDVIMPGMNGPALATQLLGSYPLLRVVYMSGYTGFHDQGLLDGEANLIAKPFTRDALLRKLRDALAGGP